MSFGMEKAINELPNQEKVKTGRILELNPNHDLLKAIEKVYANNPDDINEYASLLFNQALLIEGLPLENPSEFSKQMVDLMIKSAK
jgi:molecular chaperone HtpG